MTPVILVLAMVSFVFLLAALITDVEYFKKLEQSVAFWFHLAMIPATFFLFVLALTSRYIG
jgi:hypothetical protein